MINQWKGAPAIMMSDGENYNDKNKSFETKMNQGSKSGIFKTGCLGCLGMMSISFLAVGFLVIVFFALAFIGFLTSVLEKESSLNWTDLMSRRFTEECVGGNPGAPKKIAVIDVVGVITSEKSNFYDVANSESICAQIDMAVQDTNVAGILIYLNTPGGEVTASDEIHHAIVKARKAGTPVVAVMNSIAASGGYYVAAGCDHIVANRLTLTGSIGVIIQTYNYAELLNKIGVKSMPYTSGKMKNMLDGAKPVCSPEEVAIVNTLIRNTYLEFAKIVSEGRNIPLEKITGTEIGDGRIFDGQQALDLKLVDELGYYEDALHVLCDMAELEDQDYSVVRYTPAFSFSAFLAELSAGKNTLHVAVPGAAFNGFTLEKGKAYYLPFAQ